jgi:hypothetical protein
VDFDCRDRRLASTECADDYDNFQAECHENIIQIVISECWVALVYSDGHIRLLRDTHSGVSDNFKMKQWITDVSLPKCRNMNAKLVASAGYQHFMFYWDQYNSKGVTLFL